MTDRVTEFARKNLKNKKDFGEDARLAFRRHLDDLKRSKKKDPNFPYTFNVEKSEDRIELANKLTIAEGEGNESFTCAGFQEFIWDPFLVGYTKKQVSAGLRIVTFKYQGSRERVC